MLYQFTDTTITPTAAGDEIEKYRLSIPTGISLIHVPLKVTAVGSVAKTIESVSDLYDALGGSIKCRQLPYHLRFPNSRMAQLFRPFGQRWSRGRKID